MCECNDCKESDHACQQDCGACEGCIDADREAYWERREIEFEIDCLTGRQ